MAHPNEELLRKGYADFGRGDVDAYLNVCSSNFAFNVPGKSRIAGRYVGRAEFLGMVGKVMGGSAGSFQEEVHDVLANDTHGLVLAVHRFTRDGIQREYNTAHLYHIQAGKLMECWELPESQAQLDEAWGSASG